MLRWVGHGAIVLALTLLSQVGGVLYVAALLTQRFAPFAATRLAFAALFVAIYALAWFPIERVADLSGREALPCTTRDNLRAAAFACILHRHYVAPELANIATSLAQDVSERFPGTLTRTLDAGFPFFDGVPLPPHLSHDDGEKLDLAFFYTRDGAYQRGALGSPVGYWKFERPRGGETEPCPLAALTLRWDTPWFAPLTRRDLALDEDRTRYALRWLASSGAERGIGKVFVEPHLAHRLGVRGGVIRFQGCRTARHDDHIHIQLR